MSDKHGTLLIAGATGVAAQELIDIVERTPGWNAYGLSRNPPSGTTGAAGKTQYLKADMLDLHACRDAVRDLEITHIVYAARAPHTLYTAMLPGEKVGIESVGPNLDMLRNITMACQNPALRHVHAVQGTKWYGLHIGPFPTPAREDHPGHVPPNYYFDQRKFLVEGAAKHGWTWSVSLPGVINGRRVGTGPNLLSTIGAYAAICRKLGRPLDFPGKPGAYTALMELSDASHLAESIFWMCGDAAARNQAFNVVNGDLFRWQAIWPRIAEYFDMPAGSVRHMPLVQWMSDKAGIWDEIVEEHGLQRRPLGRVASWGFADFVFSYDYDVISSTTKIRKAGFSPMVDTEEMIFSQLDHYRGKRLIP
ncbi:NAD-dependent epimerase/dehydratase family protein [Caballeronia sp. LZ035]|uniref:NAD-dependent epimerase/dehydratase family protein n=1 Tax=Caballeronia sp. LZ035 TaxID=3038568 RepID=UPI00285C2158|nr:NAD-dependent epimerase/dehydratase family protein [Caballeronia sp. LZ035]MDR5760565.1 NAD-dependent dehydratase [Caballeronia sp. LZ035]